MLEPQSLSSLSGYLPAMGKIQLSDFFLDTVQEHLKPFKLILGEHYESSLFSYFLARSGLQRGNVVSVSWKKGKVQNINKHEGILTIEYNNTIIYIHTIDEFIANSINILDRQSQNYNVRTIYKDSVRTILEASKSHPAPLKKSVVPLQKWRWIFSQSLKEIMGDLFV